MANGKRKRIYRRWATPWEILSELPSWETFLRPGLSVGQLERLAAAQSDTDAARDMQQAKRDLWAAIGRRTGRRETPWK